MERQSSHGLQIPSDHSDRRVILPAGSLQDVPDAHGRVRAGRCEEVRHERMEVQAGDALRG